MISKKLRKQVYEKYDGHCAYCGCEITMKDMQVDHFRSQYGAERKHEAVDNSFDNLMPACRQCNLYKGPYTIESFRWALKGLLVPNLQKTFNWRLAERYGLVESHLDQDPIFYYEKVRKESEE